MPAFFVAGTGTDVGKTYIACAIIRALRGEGMVVDAFKPVVSGLDEDDWVDSDPGRLLEALGRAPSPRALAEISPWRFKAPLSPDQAARLEGRAVAFADVVAACQRKIRDAASGFLIIEGVGGVMSPINTEATNIELMTALEVPVILVTGSYLGAISHTLTALEALKGRGLTVRLLVVNETLDAPPVDDAAASLARFTQMAPGASLVVRRGETLAAQSRFLVQALT